MSFKHHEGILRKTSHFVQLALHENGLSRIILEPMLIAKFMMASRFKYTSQPLPAFLLLGVAVASMIGLFIVFAYVLLWGIILGGLLWVSSLIRQYFLSKSRSHTKKQGRIINYDQRY